MKKISILFKVILGLAICYGGNLFAQQECSIKNFNTSNGLLQNSISSMVLDNSGYLWMGTQNGLVRYDGNNFKTFLLDSTNSINNVNGTVNISYISSEREILIHSLNGDLYSIKGNQPIQLGKSKGKIAYYNWRIGDFPSSALFKKFSLPADTLVKYGWSRVNSQMLSLNTTDFFVFSKNDVNGVLFYYKNGIKQADVRLAFPFSSFLKCRKYNLLKDEKNNLYFYDSVNTKFNPIKSSLNLALKQGGKESPVFYRDICNQESYCYYNSIFYQLSVDIATNTVRFIPRFLINKNGHIFTGILYEATSSTYFLSTLTEGLFQVKLKTIKTFDLNEKIRNYTNAGSIINYSVLKTSDSTVLVPTGFQFTAATDNSIAITKKGNIYSERETIAKLGDSAILCVNGGLFYYLQRDGFKQKHVFCEEFNKNYNSFVTRLEIEGDSVWVFTVNGIYSIRNNKLNILFAGKQNEINSVFSSRLFYRLAPDELFISNYRGLFKLKTSLPYVIDTITEMKEKQVRYIDKYKDMLVFSVYKSGIYIYKANKFYKVPLDETQLAIVFCHSTYIDPNGDVWIPTDKGLFRASMASIAEAALNNNIKPFFFSYNIDDGINNPEFNGAGSPTYAVLPNGQIFYPSMGGVVTFKPAELHNSILKSPIYIEKIAIDNNILSAIASDSFNLPASFNYIVIDFSIPNFGEPQNLVLESNWDDKGWERVAPGNIPQVTLLGNMAAGYHKLSIRKRVGLGNNDYVYKTITIYKNKHLYESIWFILATTILALLLLFAIIKLNTISINRKRKALQKRVDEQTAELSKTVEVRELLINIISHDMSNPIRHIGLIAGVLAKGLEKDPAEINKSLINIQTTSEKILSGTQRIISLMNFNKQQMMVGIKEENLYELVEETIDLYASAASSKGIAIKNEVDKLAFAKIDFTIISIILNNLLSNAVKYSEKGNIIISFEKITGTGEKIIKVSDEGNGIKKEMLYIIKEVLDGHLEAIKTTTKLNTGLGYILIAELIKIHGGLSLRVQSEIDKGTTATIIIG